MAAIGQGLVEVMRDRDQRQAEEAAPESRAMSRG